MAVEVTQEGGYMKLTGLRNPIKEAERYQLPNPAYVQAIAARRTPYNIEKHVHFAKVTKDGALYVPVLCYRRYEPRVAPKLKAFGKPADLRDYQRFACDRLSALDFGILQSCAGSGKTVICSDLIRRKRVRSLIVVPTKDIMQQWYESAREFCGYRMDRAGGGFTEGNEQSNVVVSTFQTAIKRPELTKGRGLVFMDEAHRTSCKSMRDILGRTDAQYRFGCTATPWRSDGLHPALDWLLGGVKVLIGPEDIGKHILKPTIHKVETGIEIGSHCVVRGKKVRMDHTMFQNILSEHEERNSLIASKICGGVMLGHSVLVLGHRLEQLHAIADQLYSKTKWSLINGSSKTSFREAVMLAMRNGTVDVLFATYNLAAEGLDIPRLSLLIMASPNGNKTRTEQSCGRIARPFEGKLQPEVIDFVDHGATPIRMWRKRLKTYRDLGYEVKE